MGYYYYKSGTNLSAQEIKELPKFIVFPRTTLGKPGHFIKSRLQFFGEDYVQSGVDHFPAGYTIGWILIADFAGSDNKDLPRSLSESSQITDIHTNINHAYALSNTKRGIYSNKEANNFENYGCVTLGDKLSGRVVIGFEDQSYKIGCGDKAYEDILFYVDCDPIEASFDPARPEIPEKPEEDEIIRTQTTMSTLAFEDIWPSGGDYDMNDVVVECYNTITYNQKNFIKKIETKVLPVHTGAMLSDAFGIIFKGEIGDILSEESNYFRQEEDNQFIFFDNIRQSVGKTLKLVREFSNDVDKLTYDDSFNPFIVISYEPGVKNRKEVHLPNNTPSPWINQDLIGQGQDMYFLDKGGKYSFAIELFDVTNWEVVTENSIIGSANEYPEYINWVESFGQNNKDWYKYKNGR